MATLIHDIRYGLRMLVKTPGFTATAIAALALGIGANMAIFTVADSVLLRPLPYDEPDRLMMVWETDLGQGRDRNVVSVANFFDWKEQSASFEAMGAFSAYTTTLILGGEPQRIPAASVSEGLFSTLRAKAHRGRLFDQKEYSPDGDRVAVVSHRFWQNQYGANPDLIGQTLNLGGRSTTVVGILPPEFLFSYRNADIWLPWSFDAEDRANRKSHYLRVVARLESGIEVEQAQVEMDGIADRLEQEYPEWMTGWGVLVVPFHDEIVKDVRPAFLVLLGAVGLVLLIACANVANLLLARATAREREIAVRLSLGATRFRLARQLLTESVLLSIIGGAAGLLLAFWGVQTLLAIAPMDIPRADEISIGGRGLGFALLVSVLTGLAFGLAPAIRAGKSPLSETLKEGGGRGGEAGHRDRFRAALVVAEVALSLVLLIAAGLLIHSFWRLLQVDPGFNPEKTLAMSVTLPSSKYPEIHQQTSFFAALMDRLGALPGVTSVGAVSDLPFGGQGSTRSFIVEGRPLPRPGEKVDLDYRAASPDYFRTMGIPLMKGRVFTDRDDADSSLVLVINQTMAELIWPNEEPVGQGIAFEGPEGPWFEIVGVVGDTKHFGLDEAAKGAMYAPYPQKSWAWMSWMTFVLRTGGEPLSLAGSVRQEIKAMDHELPIRLRTLEQQVASSVADRRFNLLLLGLFAAIAQILAAVGIYGVMGYAVNRRAHEIGLRMALGAEVGDVLRMVVGQGMRQVLIGVTIGLAAAFALTRLMSSLLFGVSATDPVTFGGVSLILAAVAFVACYIPARRATRVDPVVALRYE